jgi:hypothetical protein
MVTIVIRSKTKERISGTCYAEYSIHQLHRNGAGELSVKSHLVTKEKAKATIKRLGLVESYSTAEGQIYDTPDGACKALFPAGIRSREEMAIIEKIDRI